MRERELVDAHVHLWNPQQFCLAWLDHEPALNKPFGLAEFPHQGAGSTIAGMVYVEVDAVPHYALLEARWAASLATHDARLQGIVAAAPVEHGERMRSYLMALQSIGPLIKGVRRNLQGETDRTFCLQPDFVRGIQLVAEYGFSFDICIRHHQLPMVVELARRCPDTRFMLDHMGKPAIKDHALDPWREQLARLAALPNAWCKVSDLVTEADPLSWTPDDLAPTLPTRWRFLGKTGSCLEAIGLSSCSPPPMTGGSRRSIHSPGISPLRRRVNSGQKTHAIFIDSEERDEKGPIGEWGVSLCAVSDRSAVSNLRLSLRR